MNGFEGAGRVVVGGALGAEGSPHAFFTGPGELSGKTVQELAGAAGWENRWDGEGWEIREFISALSQGSRFATWSYTNFITI